MSLPQDLKDCLLDHIAIAVSDLDRAQKVFEDLGLRFDGKREEVQEQKVITAFAQIDQHAHIELLKPTSEESAIHKFITQKGEGVHHLCFRVKDIRSKQTQLASLGYKFIYESPRVGAHGALVNFIHPKSANGVLIEISQHMNEGQS